MNEIRVLMVEDDLYARDLMGLLLRRDWRTQVVGEMESMLDIKHALKHERIDVILLDTENPADSDWLRLWLERFELIDHKPVVVCTSVQPSMSVLNILSREIFRGYILKSEIGYSLAWAVTLAASASWVITPGVEKLACETNHKFRTNPVVLSGDRTMFGLTPQEMEIARLGILFNLPRDNLAHDMNRSPYTVYEYISNAYAKMGIDEIFQNNTTPREYFKGDDRFLRYFGDHIDQLWDITKPNKDKDTLAFHLMTIPDIH